MVENPTFYVVDRLDHVKVIKELTESGALPKDGAAYAKNFFDLNQLESHTASDKCLWEHSGTLLKFMAAKGLTYARATVFVSKPKRLTLWHKDGDGIKCALNIPWFNTDSTWTQWYTGKDLTNTTRLNKDGSEYCISGTGKIVEPTHQTKLIQAQLINVDEYHRVNSLDAADFRGIISIRFNDKPSFESVSKRLGF